MSVKQTLRKYRDRSIDFADACLIRLADEFEIGDIFTLTRTSQSIAVAETSLFACCLL